MFLILVMHGANRKLHENDLGYLFSLSSSLGSIAKIHISLLALMHTYSFALRVLFMCICCTLCVFVVLGVFVVLLCVFFVSYVYLLYFLCVFVVLCVYLLY